jgi:hypothetical protein
VPHAPGEVALSRDFDETAKTDSCLSSVRPRHAGQEGWRSAVTNVSNRS